MPKIYNSNKTDKEIVEFLDAYFNRVNNDKGHRFHTALSMVPTNLKVLDFGCGWGQLAIAIRDKGNDVIGIDFTNEIDICNIYWKDQDNIHFTDKHITELPDEGFDIVVSCQVAEHVHNVGNFLQQINRVLKDNGKLIISIPNIINPRFFIPHFNISYERRLKEISLKMLKSYDKGNDHINSWDPRHFIILLASMGFRLQAYKPTEGIPFPIKKPFTWINKSANIKNWISRISFFKNFSYTTHYEFIKVDYVTITNND